jgi:hypothetical protein
LRDGCHDYFLYEKAEWCSCLADGARNALSPAERTRYGRDFERFEQEDLLVPDPLPPPGHGFRRLNAFASECRN